MNQLANVVLHQSTALYGSENGPKLITQRKINVLFLALDWELFEDEIYHQYQLIKLLVGYGGHPSVRIFSVFRVKLVGVTGVVRI